MYGLKAQHCTALHEPVSFRNFPSTILPWSPVRKNRRPVSFRFGEVSERIDYFRHISNYIYVWSICREKWNSGVVSFTVHQNKRLLVRLGVISVSHSNVIPAHPNLSLLSLRHLLLQTTTERYKVSISSRSQSRYITLYAVACYMGYICVVFVLTCVSISIIFTVTPGKGTPTQPNLKHTSTTFINNVPSMWYIYALVHT